MISCYLTSTKVKICQRIIWKIRDNKVRKKKDSIIDFCLKFQYIYIYIYTYIYIYIYTYIYIYIYINGWWKVSEI